MLVREDGTCTGTLGEIHLDEVVRRDATGALASGLSATRHYGPTGEARQGSVEVFIEVFARPPRLIIFGAVDFTAALARLGKVLGYRVTVCDARPVFATAARFPMADEVVVDRPERYLARVGTDLSARDAVCVLTHNSQFDVPAIAAAVSTKVGYLGAMGSRRTHADRVAHLERAGVSAEAIKRVMAPIGLDIGAQDTRGDGRGHLRRDHRAADRTARVVAPGPEGPDPLAAERTGRAANRGSRAITV